ncbi:MAG: hypothetical protein HGB00_01415 [Chlorobiaceae bacterium]|nr:hypothetical protein [Chlorobiaceae bacterium]
MVVLSKLLVLQGVPAEIQFRQDLLLFYVRHKENHYQEMLTIEGWLEH